MMRPPSRVCACMVVALIVAVGAAGSPGPWFHPTSLSLAQQWDGAHIARAVCGLPGRVVDLRIDMLANVSILPPNPELWSQSFVAVPLSPAPADPHDGTEMVFLAPWRVRLRVRWSATEHPVLALGRGSDLWQWWPAYTLAVGRLGFGSWDRSSAAAIFHDSGSDPVPVSTTAGIGDSVAGVHIDDEQNQRLVVAGSVAETLFPVGLWSRHSDFPMDRRAGSPEEVATWWRRVVRNSGDDDDRWPVVDWRGTIDNHWQWELLYRDHRLDNPLTAGTLGTVYATDISPEGTTTILGTAALRSSVVFQHWTEGGLLLGDAYSRAAARPWVAWGGILLGLGITGNMAAWLVLVFTHGTVRPGSKDAARGARVMAWVQGAALVLGSVAVLWAVWPMHVAAGLGHSLTIHRPAVSRVIVAALVAAWLLAAALLAHQLWIWGMAARTAAAWQWRHSLPAQAVLTETVCLLALWLVATGAHTRTDFETIVPLAVATLWAQLAVMRSVKAWVSRSPAAVVVLCLVGATTATGVLAALALPAAEWRAWPGRAVVANLCATFIYVGLVVVVPVLLFESVRLTRRNADAARNLASRRAAAGQPL